MGYVYIWVNLWYTMLGVCKLGKTSNLIDRAQTYITGEPIRGAFARVYEVADEHSAERVLAARLSKYHIFWGGGTEFYDAGVVDLVSAELRAARIDYKIVQPSEYPPRSTRACPETAARGHQIHLRDYQLEVAAKILEWFTHSERADVVWTCGLGKTVLVCEVILRMRARRVLVGVPSDLLRGQFAAAAARVGLPAVKFAGGEVPATGVIVATYHSMRWLTDCDFDLKVADESHHVECAEHLALFSCYDRVAAGKDLRVTATPVKRREVLDRRTVYFGVSRGYLCDFRVVLLHWKTGPVQMLVAAIREYSLEHVLYYVNNKQAAQVAREEFVQAAGLSACDYCEVITSDTRNIPYELEKFSAARFGIIFCIYILGEGFDEPAIDGVFFGQPMTSRTRIVQAAMRGCRKNTLRPDKIAYVMMPISDDGEHQFVQLGEFVAAVVDSAAGPDPECSKWMRERIVCMREGPLRDLPGSSSAAVALRLIMGGALYSPKITRDHYEYLRAVCRGMTKREYELMEDPLRVEDPPVYFAGLWTTWADFLGIDGSMYPRTIDEWRRACTRGWRDHSRKLRAIVSRAKTAREPIIVLPEVWVNLAGTRRELVKNSTVFIQQMPLFSTRRVSPHTLFRPQDLREASRGPSPSARSIGRRGLHRELVTLALPSIFLTDFLK
jgi:hypothetical protein